MISYCVLCDALPNECDHNTHRYLDPPEYQPAPKGGWTIPEHERERWETKPNPQTTPKPQPEPKPLAELEDLLRGAVWLEGDLENELHNAYSRDPLQTTMAAAAIVKAINAGQINSPGGFVRTKLRTIKAAS